MPCSSMPRPASTALILIAASTLLCACSPAAQNENGRVPGGTNQQEAINAAGDMGGANRSEEHTSELQSLMRISYAVFCLKKKTNNSKTYKINQQSII